MIGIEYNPEQLFLLKHKKIEYTQKKAPGRAVQHSTEQTRLGAFVVKTSSMFFVCTCEYLHVFLLLLRRCFDAHADVLINSIKLSHTPTWLAVMIST